VSSFLSKCDDLNPRVIQIRFFHGKDKIVNRSFENETKFRYFGMIITNQNVIQEEIKSKLNSGDACYHPVENSFFFSSAV
jgi:hypothetical protein